jgi:hypothetical protein
MGGCGRGRGSGQVQGVAKPAIATWGFCDDRREHHTHRSQVQKGNSVARIYAEVNLLGS